MVLKLAIAGIFLTQGLWETSAFAQIKATSINENTKSSNNQARRSEAPKNENILFEGYSKILLAGQHIGFVIQRHEFDAKKKRFQITYLVKTDGVGGSTLESLKAVADVDMKPVSYEYTALADKKLTSVDAKVSGNRLTANVKSGGTTKKVVADLPKGSFLGVFLYYVILRSPSGLKTETKYEYKAVAEEDAKVYDGVTTVAKEEKFNGIRAFHASNTFKDSKYSFFLTDTGEVLMTDSPASQLKTILVATPEEAFGKIKAPNDILKSLFGDTPEGTANVVARQLLAEKNKAQRPTPTKQYGIPQDSRTMIKSEAETGRTTEGKGQ